MNSLHPQSGHWFVAAQSVVTVSMEWILPKSAPLGAPLVHLIPLCQVSELGLHVVIFEEFGWCWTLSFISYFFPFYRDEVSEEFLIEDTTLK